MIWQFPVLSLKGFSLFSTLHILWPFVAATLVTFFLLRPADFCFRAANELFSVSTWGLLLFFVPATIGWGSQRAEASLICWQGWLTDEPTSGSTLCMHNAYFVEFSTRCQLYIDKMHTHGSLSKKDYVKLDAFSLLILYLCALYKWEKRKISA